MRSKTPLQNLLDHPLGAALLLALVVLLASWAVTLHWGTPVPVVHDEFVYLLQADTFAHGRLTNPTHPLADFFEAFHVLQHPTYMGKYPPLWAAILTPGMLLGFPAAGIWLANVLFAWSLLYLARAVVRPRWALAIALWGTLHFVLLSYWGHSYWGGAANALGGILTLGGVLRQRRNLRLGPAGMIGLGLALTILCRPFEGAVYGLPIGLYYFWRLWSMRGRSFTPVRRWGALLLPAGGVAAALVLQGTYNHAVTGSATLLPHTLYQETYFPDYVRFRWETPAPAPEGRPKLYDDYAAGAVFPPYRTFAEAWAGYGERLRDWYWRFLPIPSIFGLFVILLSLRWRRPGIELLVLVLFLMRPLTTAMATVSDYSHYTAAWTGATILIFAQGLRLAHVAFARGYANRRQPAFGFWPVLLLFAPVASYTMLCAGGLNDRFSRWTYMLPDVARTAVKARAEIAREATARSPGDLVVLVDYDPSYLSDIEWVYNGAEIDAQRVIWARDLGPERDQELLDYYPDRTIWRIHPKRLHGVPELELVRPPEAGSPAPSE